MTTPSGIPVLFLVAGRGSRLAPLTDDQPKSLIPFLGKPLLDRQLDTLRHVGLVEFNLVCGYRSERFVAYGFPQWSNARWRKTNMVYSLLCARRFLEECDALIVAYGDIVYEPKVVETLLGTPGDAVVAIDRNWRALWELRSENPLDDAETLRVNDLGHIVDIGRKPGGYDEIEAQYIGLIKFSRAGLERLVQVYDAPETADNPWTDGRGREQAHMTDLLRGVSASSMPLTAAPFDGGWLEVDTLDDLQRYEDLYEAGRLEEFYTPHETIAVSNSS